MAVICLLAAGCSKDSDAVVADNTKTAKVTVWMNDFPANVNFRVTA